MTLYSEQGPVEHDQADNDDYPLLEDEIHLSHFDRRVGKLPAYALAKLWKEGEYRPDRYFWCEQCHRVWKIDKAFMDGILFCARCEASADALHWWDTWPRLAFPGWVPEPEESSYWFLTGYVYDSLAYTGGLGAHRIPYEDWDKELPADIADELGDFSDDGGTPSPTTEHTNLPTGAEAAAQTP